MSKKWIWNLKRMNMEESMCHTHRRDHQLYTSGITFFTITHAWNMSKTCTLYVAKVEKEAEQPSLLLQILVQITAPTAAKNSEQRNSRGR